MSDFSYNSASQADYIARLCVLTNCADPEKVIKASFGFQQWSKSEASLLISILKRMADKGERFPSEGKATVFFDKNGSPAIPSHVFDRITKQHKDWDEIFKTKEAVIKIYGDEAARWFSSVSAGWRSELLEELDF